MISNISLKSRLTCFWLLLVLFQIAATDPKEKATLQGSVVVTIIDNFDESKSIQEIHLQITDPDQDETVLKPLSFAKLYDNGKTAVGPEDLKTGDKITVTGYESDREEFMVDSLTINEKFEEKKGVTADTRTAMHVLIDLNDASAGVSLSSASKTMDDVKSMFDKLSFSKLQFRQDANGDGRNDVYGPIRVNGSIGTCNYHGWADAALEQLKQQNVNLSLYRHLVFVVPKEIRCTWRGVAHLGCGASCRAWIRSDAPLHTYLHELGHNLTMGHAGTDTNNDGVIEDQYGDKSCNMGNNNDAGKMFNGPHSAQLNWTDETKVRNIVSNGTYKISPLASSASSRSTRPT